MKYNVIVERITKFKNIPERISAECTDLPKKGECFWFTEVKSINEGAMMVITPIIENINQISEKVLIIETRLGFSYRITIIT